jgi:hypothetical protein
MIAHVCELTTCSRPVLLFASTAVPPPRPAASQRRRAQRQSRMAIGHRSLVLEAREHDGTLKQPGG